MGFVDELAGQTILITGASSGIGAAYAEAFAARKAHLILVARRGDLLREHTERLTAQYGVEVSTMELDLTLPDAGEKLHAEHPVVDGLINNAGFAGYGTVAEKASRASAQSSKPDQSLKEIQLNCTALVDLTQRYLPGMLKRGRGFIVNVASLAAFQPLPRMAVYGATKSFVLSFTQALWKELRGTGVRALVVCPGATATDFFVTSGQLDAFGSEPSRTVDDVVRTTFRGLERKKHTIIDGLSNRLSGVISSRLPRSLALAITERLTRGTAIDPEAPADSETPTGS